MIVIRNIVVLKYRVKKIKYNVMIFSYNCRVFLRKILNYSARVSNRIMSITLCHWKATLENQLWSLCQTISIQFFTHFKISCFYILCCHIKISRCSGCDVYICFSESKLELVAQVWSKNLFSNKIISSIAIFRLNFLNFWKRFNLLLLKKIIISN